MKFRNVSEGDCKNVVSELSADRFLGNDAWLHEVTVLSESLPYIQQFSGETFVIKYDGEIMQNRDLAARFASDLVLLKKVGINPVVVHGGGNKVEEFLARFGKEGTFLNGIRVVDAETLEIAEMVLCGLVNKGIVQIISDAGGSAIGISGKDAGLVEAKKMCCTAKDEGPNNVEKIMDVGFVGEPSGVNTDLLFLLEESDFIPVIAPVCRGTNGVTYNVSPDLVAGSIASALSAAKLVIFKESSDCIRDDNGELITQMLVNDAKNLLDSGKISAKVVPELETCVKFAEETCGTAHIVNGAIPHVLLLELFTAHNTGTVLCCELGKE